MDESVKKLNSQMTAVAAARATAAVGAVINRVLGEGVTIFDPNDFIPKRVFGIAISAELIQDVKSLHGNDFTTNSGYKIGLDGDIREIKANEKGDLTMESSIKSYIDSRIEDLRDRLYNNLGVGR